VKKYPPFTYTFDPFDSAETTRVVRELRHRQGLELRVSPRPSGVRSAIGNSLNGKDNYVTRANDPSGGGVFYHPPTTVELLMIDHNVDDTAAKSKKVRQAQADAVATAVQQFQEEADEKAEAAKADAAAKVEAAKAAASATPGAGGDGKPPPTPTPVVTPTPASEKKPKTTDTAPPIDKSQPGPKPATLCHVVITVPDVDKVACLPLKRSFLTKRESNVGFAHGMMTTMSFRQPSAVQAFTGTLSSISGIVAAAVPTLINVKNSPSSAPSAAPAPETGLDAKTVGNGSGGKKIGAKTVGTAALSVQEAPPASEEDWQSTIDILNKNRTEDTQTIGMLRTLLITQLKAAGKTIDEVNALLASKQLVRVQPGEWPPDPRPR
jgi:hypothetical protein